MLPATGRGLRSKSSFEAGAGSARLFLFVLIALLGCLAYAGYSGLTVYQRLDGGRQELLAAQARLASTGKPGEAGSPQQAAAGLRRAERDFEAAGARARQDPAFQVAAVIPDGAQQVDAIARLATIGAEISRAGESVAAIAAQLDVLRSRYSGKALAPADLPEALQQAEAVARHYADAASSISKQLRTAHAEREAVATGGLLPPLRDAYSQVDSLLAQADSAFSGYQDVRAVLSEMLGVPVP